jgi:hypothetical protein
MPNTYPLPIKYSKLTPLQRREVRMQYIKEQNGLCFWCKEKLTKPPAKHIREKEIDWSLFPENFQDFPIHLQHNHETDLTEGAVHALCNAVMWQYHRR